MNFQSDVQSILAIIESAAGEYGTLGIDIKDSMVVAIRTVLENVITAPTDSVPNSLLSGAFASL